MKRLSMTHEYVLRQSLSCDDCLGFGVRRAEFSDHLDVHNRFCSDHGKLDADSIVPGRLRRLIVEI